MALFCSLLHPKGNDGYSGAEYHIVSMGFLDMKSTMFLEPHNLLKYFTNPYLTEEATLECTFVTQ